MVGSLQRSEEVDDVKLLREDLFRIISPWADITSRGEERQVDNLDCEAGMQLPGGFLKTRIVDVDEHMGSETLGQYNLDLWFGSDILGANLGSWLRGTSSTRPIITEGVN